MNILLVVLSVSGLFGLSACSTSRSHKEITVAGSTTVLPIAEIASEKYHALKQTSVLVSGLGSSAGIEAAISGTADIASSSRSLTPEEQKTGLVPAVIAHDGIAVIVNQKNPVKELTLNELRDIYAGKITNWKEVGGADLPILLVNRDEASGTREAFKTIVMGKLTFDASAAVLPGTGQVRDVVSRTVGAIGYISIGFVKSSHGSVSVKALRINHIEPTEENVASKSYPISRDLYFFTKGAPKGDVADFISFVKSRAMDATIREAGYLPNSADSAHSALKAGAHE